jgi:hypothetical protein
MKLIKALRFILALSVALLVLDAACLQNITSYAAIEIPAEEPVDEDVTVEPYPPGTRDLLPSARSLIHLFFPVA